MVEETKPGESSLLGNDKIWMKIFEIIEANVHQWQEHPIGRLPKVMTSVNAPKMRTALVEYITKIRDAQDAKAASIMEKKCQERVGALWDEVVCPLCYRLNPQHAPTAYNEACHWCQDKEDWIGKLSRSRRK